MDRQANPELAGEPGAVAAAGQHEAIAGDAAAVRHQSRDPVAFALEPRDGRAEAQLDALAGGMAGQALGELVAVAGVVAAKVHAAGEPAADRRQRRLQRDAGPAIDDVDRLAELAIDRRLLGRLGERRRIAIDPQIAAVVAVVGDAALGRHHVELIAAVDGEPEHRLGIVPPALRCAVRQEAQAPADHPRQRPQAQQEGRLLAAEVAQDQFRDAGCGPGVRHPRGDQPAIGEAGLERRALLAVDQHHRMPVAGQLVGGGDADDAGAENDGGQRPRLAVALPAGFALVARRAAALAFGRAATGRPIWA